MQWIEIILYGALIFSAIAGIIKYILMEYRTGKIRNSPVETVKATAYLKHPDGVPVMAGRTTNYVYHITFHTNTGDVLKLYMDRDAFFRIPEDASGELVFQGEKLWRFTLDDGTEIRQ